jgi:hypothetical protein
MITRRDFIIAGGSAAIALSFPGLATAARSPKSGLLTISSYYHTMEDALRGDHHIALSGNRMSDLRLLETIFSEAQEPRVTLFVDTADSVMLDIALSRVNSPYVAMKDTDGTQSYRLASEFGA